jgi:hypothetical protein
MNSQGIHHLLLVQVFRLQLEHERVQEILEFRNSHYLIVYILLTKVINKFINDKLLAQKSRHPHSLKHSNNAKEKIRNLANDLGLPTDDYEIECVGERNFQERGLDIVSWIPFEDKCQNKIIFLCQCACGKQYESKQHDLRRFEHYYRFYRTKPQRTLFVPYALINPKDGKFYHSDYIEDDYLIFERLRIISLAKRSEDVLTLLKSTCLVEICIQDYYT